MSNSNLNSVLEYLFEEGIFGKSFNDPNKKRPLSSPPEKNTPEENKFINQIDKWYNSHLVSKSLIDFANNINNVMPDVMAGKYPELKPASGEVYRGIKIDLQTLLSILKLDSLELKPGKGVVVNKPGLLSPKPQKYYPSGKQISSWSISPKSASFFARTDSYNDNEKLLSVLFVARTDDPENTFIVNPLEMKKAYKSSITAYEHEDEVVGVGPIKFVRAVVYSSFSTESAVHQRINDFIEMIYDESAKAIYSELQTPGSDISKFVTELNQKVASLGAPKPFKSYVSNPRSVQQAIMHISRYMISTIEDVFNRSKKPKEITSLNVLYYDNFINDIVLAYRAGKNPFQNLRTIKKLVVDIMTQKNVEHKYELFRTDGVYDRRQGPDASERALLRLSKGVRR